MTSCSRCWGSTGPACGRGGGRSFWRWAATPSPEPDGDVTAGTLLGGRVQYHQYAQGYRTGIEPVLLAAMVPATEAARVIEGGSGAGAALLCLAARVPGISGVGIELDARLVARANANAALNLFHDRLGFVVGDVGAQAGPAAFDHAMANPPWHDARGTASPDAARDRAKRLPGALIDRWTAALARAVRPHGTMSLALATANLDAAMAAAAAHGWGTIRLLPLWPRAGREARIVLLQAVRGGRGATRLMPGLVLHEGDGYSVAVQAILRGSVLPVSKDGRGSAPNPAGAEGPRPPFVRVGAER